MDIPHAGAVAAHHKHPAATDLVEIVPLGLVALDVLIGKTLDFTKSGVLYPSINQDVDLNQ